MPMDLDYNQCGFSAERIEDEELFEREVVGEDDDLMVVDYLLRMALTNQ